MAKSAITLAPADEAADALLVKPKQSKSSNTKGILALGLLAFALGLLATPSLRQSGAFPAGRTASSRRVSAAWPTTTTVT